MENLTQNNTPTIESILATMQEITRSFVAVRQNFEKAEAKAEKERQEEEKERKKEEKSFRKLMAESNKGRKERQDLMRSIKAMQKELGGVSNSNGDVAESYFINSFKKSMSFAGQQYDEITPNLRKSVKALHLQGEYDIVLYNCTSIVIIEIKYKADKDDIAELLQKAPIFKQLFPQYANYDIYLGLAALHINAKTEKESIKQGVAVIKQVGKTMVINDAQLKVF